MRVIKVESGGHPQANGVPLKLVSIDDVPASNGFNPGLKFEFHGKAGKVFRTIGEKITPTTAAGKFLAGFYGLEELPTDQEIDLDKLIGRTFLADVCPSPQGKATRVERVYPMPNRAPAQAPPKPAPEPDSDEDSIPF